MRAFYEWLFNFSEAVIVPVASAVVLAIFYLAVVFPIHLTVLIVVFVISAVAALITPLAPLWSVFSKIVQKLEKFK